MRASISGVVREGVIAACLTGLMILVFLGSWRSTLIVSTSIPLSILASISVLYAFGETLNVMTLGGLALAVGILVDDATVEIENEPPAPGHGEADQARDPRRGVGGCHARDRGHAVHLHRVRPDLPAARRRGFLFAPLAMAVVFAMLASYLLSRTLVPPMCRLR